MTTTLQPLDYRSPSAPSGSWITQTWALFVDAYRELNAKKLFWITLILSLMVVIAFAFVSINKDGISVFGVDFENKAWSTDIIPAATFYKVIFTSIAIPWWLGVIATILALVSVCGVFPDFLSGGSIDLYLSKPISRLRLFLTKYIASLMFVALQVLVFSFASFVLIGIKSGAWEFGIFLAVPLVTLFFSYLFCVCVLLGIVTRSPLASLLITILFWLFLFSLNTTDAALAVFKSAKDEQVSDQKALIEKNQKIIDRNKEIAPDKPAINDAWEGQQRGAKENLVKFEEDATKLTWWYDLFRMIKAPLPKTGETVELMNRWLVEPEPMMRVQEQSARDQTRRREEFRKRRGTTTRAEDNEAVRMDPEDPDVMQRVQEELGARKAATIIGTSLGFEAFVLGIAAWIFCRRDF